MPDIPLTCKKCGNPIKDSDKYCLHCGTKILNDDKLEPHWYWIIWGSFFIPYLGPWVIILTTSIAYYIWKNEYPNKARAINRQGFLAFGFAFVFLIFLMVVIPKVVGRHY